MSKFVPNPSFTEQLEQSAKFRLFLRGVAAVGAERAEAMARAEAFDSGDYAASFEGTTATTPEGVVGRIRNVDWKAGLLEVHGTQNGRGRAILRRSAETLSTRFLEGGRS